MSAMLRSVKKFFSPWRHPFRTLFIVIALIIFCIWTLFFKKNDNAANYITATVERADIQNLVTSTGILQPREYVDVGAQVSGQLKKLYVDIGSQVKAGDLLAEIDATVYTAKVDGIRAQLLNQQAQLGDREAQLNLAKIHVNRQQNLYKEDATTQESLQTAEADLQSSQSQLKALQAQIQQTEFSLRVEEANLTYARIYAPMDGTVVSITSRQGQTLNANQQAPTIMRIADLSIMTVQTQVSEADIGKLHVGMPVYFTTLGGQDYRWYSKLERIEPTPTVTNNVVLYNALFDVPNESHVLMTQMSTQVFFIQASARDALIIPASAVNLKLRKPGETADRKSSWAEHNQSDKQIPAETEKNKTSDDKKTMTKNDHKENFANAGDKKADAETASTDKTADKADGNDPRQNRKHRPRSAPPSATDELKPQPAVVQVMDAKGNLAERTIIVGISNRVQVQVLEGLQEGEKVVSGIRQQEKISAANNASPMGPGPGSPAGGARMMR